MYYNSREKKNTHIRFHESDDPSILRNKLIHKLSVVFRFWPDPCQNSVKYSAAACRHRGNGPSTRCIYFRLCRNTAHKYQSVWSQEWNQGGRVVPHNAATGEVRDRCCTPCLVSIPLSLSLSPRTHTRAHAPPSYSHTWNTRHHHPHANSSQGNE